MIPFLNAVSCVKELHRAYKAIINNKVDKVSKITKIDKINKIRILFRCRLWLFHRKQLHDYRMQGSGIVLRLSEITRGKQSVIEL